MNFCGVFKGAIESASSQKQIAAIPALQLPAVGSMTGATATDPDNIPPTFCKPNRGTLCMLPHCR
jgi:hypothetical protein